LKLVLFKEKDYPEILVLEMGADRPGDIKYLTSFVKPKIAIITAVAPVHTEFFKTLKGVAKEKSELIKALPKDGLAILNNDDELVMEMKNLSQAETVTYGFSDKADINAREIKRNQGLNFKLHYQGSSVVPVFLEKVIAPYLISSVLPAVAVGLFYELNLVDITHALKSFQPPPGRMNKISGIKDTIIIDDTYNSSPLAAKKALKVLSSFPADPSVQRFAVLGDMLELGSLSEQAHREVGKIVARLRIDVLITVGERARDIARGAKSAGMSEDRVFSFSDTLEAGKFLQSRISKGDVILVKGSQGIRMEHIVKEIMADPQFAQELLVRQGKEWR
jgi:UDP-N-acetylmuramoyl-tripeptide--D-alanyl-D-alanine ligase